MLLKWPGQATHPDFCGCQCRGARWPPVGPYKAQHLQPADHFSHHARPTSPPPLSGTVSQPCHGNIFILYILIGAGEAYSNYFSSSFIAMLLLQA